MTSDHLVYTVMLPADFPLERLEKVFKENTVPRLEQRTVITHLFGDMRFSREAWEHHGRNIALTMWKELTK